VKCFTECLKLFLSDIIFLHGFKYTFCVFFKSLDRNETLLYVLYRLRSGFVRLSCECRSRVETQLLNI
jgi:hypothetical protein